MPQVLKQWSGSPSEVAFQGLLFRDFPIVASVGAGVAFTTVQGQMLLPVAAKVVLAAVSFAAIQSVDGGHEFNVVVGTGTYETAPVAAAASTTASGTPSHDGTVTVTVNGHDVVYTEVSGDTDVTTLMGHVVTAVNSDSTANKLVVASNIAGALTLTALEKGVNGNAITVVIASTDSAPLAFTAFGPNLSGGAEGSSLTTAPADNSQSGPPPGGLGVPTVFAAAGQAVFAANQKLAVGAGIGVPAAIGPPLAAPTTSTGGVLRYPASVPDAVFPAGTLLTLRAGTPTTVGSITNFLVSLALLPVRTRQSLTAGEYLLTPGTDF